MDAQVFGAFIQARRKELGMSQAQLAEKLHVTAKAVSRWERGVGFPNIELLQPLAQTLEITLVELMRSQRMAAEIPKEEASEIVTETIESFRKQERKRRWNIYLLFGGLVLVFAAQSFLQWVYYDYGQGLDSQWARLVFRLIIMLGGIYGARAVYYIAWNEYGKLKDKKTVHKGLLICIAAVAIGISFIIGYQGWRYGDAVTPIFIVLLFAAIAAGCYFYFFYGKDKKE